MCTARAGSRRRSDLHNADSVCPREQLHDEERHLVRRLPEIGDLDDVLVADGGGGARLAAEALEQILAPRPAPA